MTLAHRPWVAAFLVAAVASAASVGSASAGQSTPADPKCTVKGTAGSDVLRGSSAGDVICGRGGDDLVFAGGNRDVILGGSGEDELHGEGGSDRLAGGLGIDSLDGGPGGNTCGANGLSRTPNLCVGSVTVRDFSIAPRRVNTSERGRRVIVEIAITDSRSPAPVELFGVTIQSDRSASPQVVGALFLESGTAEQGRWSGPVYIPEQSHPGPYQIGLFTLDDFDARVALPGLDRLPADLLRKAGFDSGFEQTGRGSNDPPELRRLGFAPQEIDTSQGSQTTAFEFRVVDDTGVGQMSVTLKGPTPEARRLLFPSADSRVSGDSRDGVYSVPVELPRHSAPGEWWVEDLTLFDRYTGVTYTRPELIDRGLDAGFRQRGPGDTTPPTLRGFVATPDHVDVTDGGNVEIELEATITDDLSGVAEWTVSAAPGPFATYFAPPDSLEFFGQGRYWWPRGIAAPGPPPPPPPPGTYGWEVKVVDRAGNARSYVEADLAAAGFTAAIHNGP